MSTFHGTLSKGNDHLRIQVVQHQCRGRGKWIGQVGCIWDRFTAYEGALAHLQAVVVNICVWIMQVRGKIRASLRERKHTCESNRWVCSGESASESESWKKMKYGEHRRRGKVINT